MIVLDKDGKMPKYEIFSKSGGSFGVYEAASPEAAFAAMVVDGDGDVGDESVGTIEDWQITELTDDDQSSDL